MILKYNFCIEFSKTIRVLGIILTTIIIITLIIIIIGGMIDMYKTVTYGKPEDMRESVKSLIRRIIAGIIVVLIPVVVPEVFSYIFGKYSNEDMCNECLLKPTQARCAHLIEISEAEKTDYFKEKNSEYENMPISNLYDVPLSIRKKNYRTTKKSSNYSEKKVTIPQNSTDTQQRVLQAADSMSKQVEQDVKNGKRWYYLNKGCSKTFEQAEAKGVYKSNCALGVVWSLKTAGVLDTNMSLYKKYSNGVDSYGGNMSEEQLEQAFIIIDGNGRYAKDLISDETLQAGDVVMYYHQGHTNMYAGNNLWYDMGRNFTGGYGSMEEYYFTTFGPIRIKYYENSQVWKILRAK